MPLVRPLLAGALAGAFALPAAAATWLCGLSEDAVRLVCLADAEPQPVHAPTPPAVAVQVRGTSFPLDPARVWHVDLWSTPSDAAFVEQLARATICYRSPDCRVVMGRLPLPPGLMVAQR